MNYKIDCDAGSNTYSVVVTLTDRELAAAKAMPVATEGIAGNHLCGPNVTSPARFGGKCFDGYDREVKTCMTQFQAELDAAIDRRG